MRFERFGDSSTFPSLITDIGSKLNSMEQYNDVNITMNFFKKPILLMNEFF